MFAVIKTGGKQYRVAQDEVIVVEKLAGDAGDTLVFGDVLMIGDGDKVEMGAPMIGGAQVVGEVVEQRRAAKIIIFKKKQRNTYRRKQGHRQTETVVKITEILAKGGKTVEKKAAAPKKAEAKAAPAAKAEGGDNLTKLTGVGKVAAGKLNDEGYTTFAQIAALTDEQFAKLDADVFKGRVPKDQLVSEAKELSK
ncbi:MAG: 50S ribosomal protein L21 [Alphaproteobacteria bacterium]|nr:50S ribosomal protein L21 [Alphaproteobacteria bacterium]